MLTHIIAVYDRKTKQYAQMMNPRNIVRIQQEFDDVCKNPDSIYYKNPEDYEVHQLGCFNDSPEHDPEIQNQWFARPNVIATGSNNANS